MLCYHSFIVNAIFIGLVIYLNKLPRLVAQNTGPVRPSFKNSGSVRSDLAESASISKDFSQASFDLKGTKKLRRKLQGEKFYLNPAIRRSSSRSFGGKPIFDESSIKPGTCHTMSDRKSIALGFLPHGNESLSLTYLDNLITCGLPCFKENGKGAKEYPESFGNDCCDCCEAQNELYSAQMFSSNGCGDCIKNFIEKSYADAKVKKCVETKNRQARIPMGVLQMEYNCYTCVDEEYETEEGIDENGEAAMETRTTVDLNKNKGTTEIDTEMAYRKEKQGKTKSGKTTKNRRTTISSNSNRVVTKKNSKTTVNTGKLKTDPIYKQCYTSTKQTCSNDFLIGKYDGLNYEVCMNFCNEDDICKFVSFGVKDNGDKFCRKYWSCDRSRTAKNAATTYSKERICPGRSNIGDKISQTKSSTGSRTITNKLKRNMRTTAMTRKLTTGVFKTTNAPHITASFITKIAKHMPRKYQHQFSRKTTSSKARQTTLGITRPLKIKNRGIGSKKSSVAHKYTTTFYNNQESEKGGQHDLKWEMTFENTNEKHFQPQKKDLSTLIANVLGASSVLVDVDLKKPENNENQYIVAVVTLGKDVIPNLKQSIFSFDFISSINNKLADSKTLQGIILSTVTRLISMGSSEIDESFLTSYHMVNYTISIGKECRGTSIIRSGWNNLKQAIINCNVNKHCVGVYDENRDEQKLSTCKKLERSKQPKRGGYYEKISVKTKISIFDSDCRDGFLRKDGFIKVGPNKSIGDAFTIKDIDTCSLICKLRPDCKSYQFNLKQSSCKLHEIAIPTSKKNKKDWILCIKI